MRASFGGTTLVGVLAALAAGSCTPARHRAGQPRPADRDLITREQMLAYRFPSAFDAVQALRSNWLQERGPDSFRTPTPVWVYMDNVRLGKVESLRAIAPSSVVFIRHYDGVDATGRWGVGHGQGVIYVSTHH